MSRLVSLVAAGTLSIGLLASCGKADVEADVQSTSATLNLPTQIVGLEVVAEELNEEELDKVDRPYIDNIAVFSLREGDLLRATLQVARFNRLARPEDASFRGQILGLLGGQRPFDITVGDTEISATTGTGQTVFAWFGGRGMFVLSIQRDYPFPRTLLRRLIERDLEL